MNEDMNRFGFDTNGHICDYGEEEPYPMTTIEILEELNRLDQANYELSSECTSVNWTNEFLREQVEVLERALDLVCQKLQCELADPNEELYTKTLNEYIYYFKKLALTERGKQ